jgi:hypothetical protein
MIKYYFDLDKVSSIKLKLEGISDYKWFNEIKPQPKYFLGFKIGSTQGVKAGWGEYEDSNWRKDTDYFDDFKSYRVDFENRIVFIRPMVTVFLGYKDSYTNYFDTDQQANSYVKRLIDNSKKNFQVIIEK